MNTRERAHYFLNYGVLFVVAIVCQARGTRVIYNSRTGIFSHQSYMFLSLLDSMNRRFEFSNRKVVVADVRRERSKSMEPFFGELHYHESSSATITRLECVA